LFTVTVETSFTALHQLTMADGQKEDLHTHDWLVRTAVSTVKLDQNGLAVDFNDLKAKIEQVTSGFDGADLQELACFKQANTSAEIIAKYIYDTLDPLLSAHLTLRYVEIREAPGCRAKYCK